MYGIGGFETIRRHQVRVSCLRMNKSNYIDDVFHDFNLFTGSQVADCFLAKGVRTFADACLYIRNLPYGRNSDKSNRLLVISERRGTCSGKHALLAELAREQHKPFELYLGFFKISKDTHPVIAPILERNNLSYYPELHAYLVSFGVKYDFTGEPNPIHPTLEFLKEFPVLPTQVESYKERAHKEFLENWLITEGLHNRLTLQQLWNIREECIAARSGA